MVYFVNIVLYFFLMLIQTVVMPILFHGEGGYDLVIILVLYMGFYRSAVESLPVILIMGLLMESLSGGPFGIFITTYIWFFVLVKIVIRFIHADSILLLPVAVMAGVLTENLIVLLSASLGKTELHYSLISVKIPLKQLIWSFFTGPFVFLFVKFVHSISDNWFSSSFGPEKADGDFSG